MVFLMPDGTLSISADDFGLNWSDDTPEYVEIEETSADEPDEWIRGYIKVETLRELLKKIDERNEK